MLNLLLTILFCNIDLSVVVEIISIIASSILSIVAIAISVKTLKQSNEAIIESSRANIAFYNVPKALDDINTTLQNISERF